MPGEPLYRTIVTNAVFESMKANVSEIRLQRWPLNVAAAMRNVQAFSTPGPMALPILAVRDCRRALQENPNDAGTWFWLQSAYRVLARHKDLYQGCEVVVVTNQR